ncbi:hypothetical protein OR16_16207 [Cupriavidus basilensis OR16]|uniref:Uncharacterized protein n=1 Tax=Cupriavidus basilensis OR16 TaxID=1127483 RepID=H1S5U8_9BURK|nr:hypothetical protein [Cupriavidus basilensis]EHP42180.1 hypothetical protein OR16_16207 [Cupriavidus basilensis OR16]
MLELRPSCEHCNKALPPASLWKGNNFLGNNPASTNIKHRPVDPATHAQFSAAIRGIPPERR